MMKVGFMNESFVNAKSTAHNPMRTFGDKIFYDQQSLFFCQTGGNFQFPAARLASSKIFVLVSLSVDEILMYSINLFHYTPQ